MTPPSLYTAEAPQVPPSPAALTEQLIQAAQERGLTSKRVADSILQFSSPVDYSDLDQAQRVVAEKLFTGLTQVVILLPDQDAEQVEGRPLTFAWYWWWAGDRLPGERARRDLQRLTRAEDIGGAADKIAKVLALQPSTV